MLPARCAQRNNLDESVHNRHLNARLIKCGIESLHSLFASLASIGASTKPLLVVSFLPYLTITMELGNRTKAEAVSSAIEDADHDSYTRDERDLIRLGKKPQLKRTFGFMQILGFSCTVLVTWEGILS